MESNESWTGQEIAEYIRPLPDWLVGDGWYSRILRGPDWEILGLLQTAALWMKDRGVARNESVLVPVDGLMTELDRSRRTITNSLKRLESFGLIMRTAPRYGWRGILNYRLLFLVRKVSLPPENMWRKDWKVPGKLWNRITSGDIFTTLPTLLLSITIIMSQVHPLMYLMLHSPRPEKGSLKHRQIPGR